MSTILCAYDGTDSSRRALERAVQEARDHHSRITVLSVSEMPLSPESPRYFGTLDDISPEEGDPLPATADVVAHLTEARDYLAREGLDADLAWSAGEPGREIVDTAKRINARAIVLGEHHHGALLRMFSGGDVDENVRREAGCPVILA